MDSTCLELIGRVPAATPQDELGHEHALILQAQRGDRAAFEELVRLYESNVLRLTLQFVRSPEEARDLYQEAFLKIYRSLHRFRLQARFSTWVYRIVVNVCLDHLRRTRHRREVQPGSDNPNEPEFFQALPEERPELNPERALRSREIAQRLEQALGRLSPRERLVFELRHYQGLKLRAIGEYCGTSEETAKNCLFRATQKLRQELKEIV
ncbi:MAG: sigma-70 family RNA polymerase sigma factor [Acidobacteria bacterium]|nr:sigma-70 family RNA polymerase sigma factor [Acidobacteriota bacterium]